MKKLSRFVVVFVLCHAAYAAYCQQMKEGRLGLFAIPGLGIHLDKLPKINVRIPFLEGFGKDAQDVAAVISGKSNVVIGNDVVPDGEATPVWDFEDIIDPLIRKYAEMIDMDVHDIANYPLYKFVDAWYGVRYRWGGEDKGGIDCSALSRKLYNSIYGYELARTSKQQHRQCEKIKHVRDAEEGDLIFFRMNRMRISHVGVYLANGYFVHASKSQGVMISNLNSKYWHRRYAGCGRVERDEKKDYESDMLQ